MNTCRFSKLDPRELIGVLEGAAVACSMVMPNEEAVPVGRGKPRTRTALLLGAIALHHWLRHSL